MIPANLVGIDVAEQMGALAGIAFVVAVGAAALALVRKGDRPARYLLLGLSPPLIVGLPGSGCSRPAASSDSPNRAS